MPLVSHPDVRAIDSARLVAAVPMVLRSKSRRAAGVKLPAASDRRGVQDGGAILPLLPVRGVRFAWPEPSISALARRLFAALLDNLWDIASLEEMAGI